MARGRVLLLLLLVLAGVIAWQLGWQADASPEAAPTPAPPPPFQAAWATEQDWLVDRITRDVLEMGSYAASGVLPAADSSLRPPAPRFELHLFSPRLYEPIARETLGQPVTLLAATPDDDREDTRLLSTLLDPRHLVLVAEDLALSSRLEVTPRDPRVHERAALLLAAFALGDAAGDSTDTRPTLTRLTAHVALARALRGGAEPGLARVYAEAALVTLLGREGDASERLDALAATAASPAEKAWVRALRLRNTGDWRIARDEKELAPLEVREEFRALVQGQGDDAALAWLDPREPALVPDWGRLALAVGSPSEATRNRFADVTTALDLAQATEVLTRLRGAPADEKAFLDALNERPAGTMRGDEAGKPRIAVLGWGLWADRFQRDLVFDLIRAHGHRSMLGRPGERRVFAEQSRSCFGRLRLYPVVLRAHAEEATGYRTAMAAVRELALHSPERLTGGHWRRILAPERFARVPRDLPDPNAWFRPALPQGTLLDVEARLEVAQELLTMRDPELAGLRDLAPHNLALARRAAARLPADERSVADLLAVYGPLADYQVTVMAGLARAAWSDPVAFRSRQGALCEIDGSFCLPLGRRLEELGFPDEAAVAYQQGFDRARDRVAAASPSGWLVDYYLDHGQPKQAEGVAREAAEIGSSDGLLTMARLMERSGRLSAAEDYYRRIQDRYRDATPLAGFYYRQSRVEGRTDYETKLRETLALALPSGLEAFERARLPKTPSDGVVIREENDTTQRYGLHIGHVIVALDGFRVRDVGTYSFVRALSQSAEMTLVVWRGTSYDELEVEPRDRQFRIDMDTFAPPN